MRARAAGREVVVITGASAGVGRALARRFAQGGADVAVLARGATGLAATADEVEAYGVRSLAIRVDVADAAQVEAAAAQIERELGPIDIWINNAMATVFGRITDVTPAELRRVTDVTYHGAVWGTKAALARMRTRERGTIVQIGSALAYRPIPLQAAYCAAKHALRAFTVSLRTELLHDRIDVRLTMIHLPAVNTPQFGWSRTHMPCEAQPVPPIFQPEIIAHTVHWAAHARHPRREIYLGWPAIQAIVGDKLAPGLVDRYLARTGFDAQQIARPVAPDHRDNLFTPVDGDFGARGKFNARAQEHARLARAVARLGAGGLRAAIAVFAVTLLVLAGLALFWFA